MLHHVPKLWQWIPLSPAWCVSSPKISNLVISKNLLAIPSTTCTGWFWHALPVFPIKKNLQKLSYMENIMDQEFELFFHCSPGYWMCQLKKHPIPGLHNLWQPGYEKMERELENEEEMESKWKENKEMEWGLLVTFPHFLFISSLSLHFQISHCLIFSQNVKFGTFVPNVTKKLNKRAMRKYFLVEFAARKLRNPRENLGQGCKVATRLRMLRLQEKTLDILWQQGVSGPPCLPGPS